MGEKHFLLAFGAADVPCSKGQDSRRGCSGWAFARGRRYFRATPHRSPSVGTTVALVNGREQRCDPTTSDGVSTRFCDTTDGTDVSDTETAATTIETRSRTPIAERASRIRRFGILFTVDPKSLLFACSDSRDPVVDRCVRRDCWCRVYYGQFEAKASAFRAGMKLTNSIQPPTMALMGFQRNLQGV